MVVVFIGVIAGKTGYFPGDVTVLDTTTIFCIDPGAGISGIGNGCIIAPLQYDIIPASIWFIKEKLAERVFNPISNANLNDCISAGKFVFNTDTRCITSEPRRMAASYSIAYKFAN